MSSTSMTVRKRRDGTVKVDKPPERHGFAARFLQREIAAGNVTVLITLNDADEPITYAMTGFEIGDDGQPNWTQLEAVRVDTVVRKKEAGSDG
jgi:hypothetical protein